MSRPVPVEKFGMIYAGAQKNIGPAGVCMVIVREDLLARVPKELPAMLKYTTFSEKNSLYNTPPAFAIYVIQMVLKWIEETIGGLSRMAELNTEKAKLLYGAMEDGFYKATADPDSMSQMNVTFRLPSEELEKQFVAEAQKNSLGGLKGHRSVGGCRASIYNATDIVAIKDLVAFMKDFEKKNG